MNAPTRNEGRDTHIVHTPTVHTPTVHTPTVHTPTVHTPIVLTPEGQKQKDSWSSLNSWPCQTGEFQV